MYLRINPLRAEVEISSLPWISNVPDIHMRAGSLVITSIVIVKKHGIYAIGREYNTKVMKVMPREYAIALI